MGKGVAILGLILIIVAILPIIMPMLGVDLLDPFLDYLFILNLYTLNLGGYEFSELMLILLGLGIVLLIVGAVR